MGELLNGFCSKKAVVRPGTVFCNHLGSADPDSSYKKGKTSPQKFPGDVFAVLNYCNLDLFLHQLPHIPRSWYLNF